MAAAVRPGAYPRRPPAEPRSVTFSHGAQAGGRCPSDATRAEAEASIHENSGHTTLRADGVYGGAGRAVDAQFRLSVGAVGIGPGGAPRRGGSRQRRFDRGQSVTWNGASFVKTIAADAVALVRLGHRSLVSHRSESRARFVRLPAENRVTTPVRPAGDRAGRHRSGRRGGRRVAGRGNYLGRIPRERCEGRGPCSVLSLRLATFFDDRRLVRNCATNLARRRVLPDSSRTSPKRTYGTTAFAMARGRRRCRCPRRKRRANARRSSNSRDAHREIAVATSPATSVHLTSSAAGISRRLR